MYEDDTIRLFGVANLLKNKKNDKDNWERDDIPDIKEQALTGKYDHNFDAPGSDFQRAHHYNQEHLFLIIYRMTTTLELKLNWLSSRSIQKNFLRFFYSPETHDLTESRTKYI
jgi:hypothetical protein